MEQSQRDKRASRFHKVLDTLYWRRPTAELRGGGGTFTTNTLLLCVKLTVLLDTHLGRYRVSSGFSCNMNVPVKDFFAPRQEFHM